MPHKSSRKSYPASKGHKAKLPNPLKDIKRGVEELREQGKGAVERVKEGVRKIKKHVGK